MTHPTVSQFVEELRTFQSDDELEKYQTRFGFDADDQDEDDVFIGVRMGEVFDLAKKYVDTTPEDIDVLLESPIHEARVGAVSIMDWRARRKSTPEDRRRELFDRYLRRHDRIDGWDLVDRAAPHVIGGYLFEYARPRNRVQFPGRRRARASGNCTPDSEQVIGSTYYLDLTALGRQEG